MAGSRKPKVSRKIFRSPTAGAMAITAVDGKACDLHIKTRIVNVRSSTVFRKNAVLSVILQKQKSGPVAVVVEPKTKEPIGSLFPLEIDTLILCLEARFKYVATVLEASGADVLVEVSLAPK